MLGYVNHLLTSQKCIFHLGFSLARTRTAPPYPGHCRRWDISHEQLLWTFMLASYAKWYSFTPPHWPNFPPPLTGLIDRDGTGRMKT